MGKMKQSDASRIQSTQAKSGGDMSSGGFAARAQSAGDRNANDAEESYGWGVQSFGGPPRGKDGSGSSNTGAGASQKK